MQALAIINKNYTILMQTLMYLQLILKAHEEGKPLGTVDIESMLRW